MNIQKHILDYIHFEDYSILYSEWDNSTLVFHLDSVLLLPLHPANISHKYMVVSHVLAIINNAKVESCFYTDYTKAKEEGRRIGKQIYTEEEDAEYIDADIIDRSKSTKILDFFLKQEDETLYLVGSFGNHTEFKISFSSIELVLPDLNDNNNIEIIE